MLNDIFHTPDELGVLLLPVFEKYNVKRAVLFGSYAKGNPGENSDIDLLVDSGLRGLKFISLYEDINQLIGCDVDLFDITQIEKNSRIENEIAATGVIIHEK